MAQVLTAIIVLSQRLIVLFSGSGVEVGPARHRVLHDLRSLGVNPHPDRGIRVPPGRRCQGDPYCSGLKIYIFIFSFFFRHSLSVNLETLYLNFWERSE